MQAAPLQQSEACEVSSRHKILDALEHPISKSCIMTSKLYPCTSKQNYEQSSCRGVKLKPTIFEVHQSCSQHDFRTRSKNIATGTGTAKARDWFKRLYRPKVSSNGSALLLASRIRDNRDRRYTLPYVAGVMRLSRGTFRRIRKPLIRGH